MACGIIPIFFMKKQENNRMGIFYKIVEDV